MTRIVIKGINYTEVRSVSKKSPKETVMFWQLARDRKTQECGIWRNGEKIHGFDVFGKQINIPK